jgi:hypothetical protein
MANGADGGNPPMWPAPGPPSGSLAGGGIPVTSWLQVIRPDDLLSLTFGLVNLAVQDGHLVRADPGSPAIIIVGLPPQHITEAPVPAGSAAGPPPAAAAIAGGSQLAFTVPDGVTSLPLNLPTLLGWAALDPVPPAQPAGTPGKPSGSGSILELPYRMLLAVDGAEWRHPVAAVLDAVTGTAELWRTTAPAPALHVTWSQDRDPPPHPLPHPPSSPPGPVPVLPDVQDPLSGLRSQIAAQAPALEVDSLTLSALGATASLHAALPAAVTLTTGQGPVTVTDWHHITSLGRDSYVRTVQQGYLAPFGHRAAVVTVYERVPVTAAGDDGGTAPLEELVSTSRVVILSPQVDYTGPVAAAAYAAQHPMMSVPLRKVQLPDLAAPLVVGPDLAKSGGLISTQQGPFSFRAVAEDLSGASVELSLPMAFVPEGVSDLSTIYDGLKMAADLSGQKVAFVGLPGAAAAAVDELDGSVLPVDSMAFSLFSPADPSIPFLPQLQSAAVRVLSASAVAGVAAQPWNIVYHPQYLLQGIDPAVNRGTVFAQVTNTPLLQMAADAAGGLAAPQLPIDGLSRALGPVAGATDLIGGKFDPTKLLSQLENSVFLGSIKLSDMLAPIAGFDPAKVPAFVRSKLPQAIQTTFTWTPALHSSPVTPPPPTPPPGAQGNPGNQVPGFLSIDTSEAAFSLSVTVTAPLDPDPSQLPTSEVHGRLTNINFTFLGAVRLDVDLLEFTATTGRKVDLTTGRDLSIGFTGDLAFLNELAKALPADGFADPPYVDADASGVTAGYTLAIPSLDIGIVSIENIAFAAALSLPLTMPPQPLGLRLDFASREHPFLVSISFIGGGGFFCADVGSDGIHLIEGSLDLAASLSVDLVVVSAEVHAMAGFYFGIGQQGTTFSAFLRIGGSVDLLGLISVSVELYLALGYSSDHSDIFGQASLTLGVHVLFVSKSVTLSMEKHFPVPGAASGHAVTAVPADAAGPAAPVPASFGDLIAPADWDLYLGAFA